MKFFLSIALISLFFLQNVSSQEVSKKSNIIETYKGASYYMHNVTAGETVQTIARLYNVSNVEILKANPEISSGLQPNQVIRIPVKSSTTGDNSNGNGSSAGQAKPDNAFHVVQSKETWYGISRMYKIPVEQLISANPSVDTLKIGMSIRIPKVTETYKIVTSDFAEHTAQAGETIYGIAKKYNTSTDELIRINPSLVNGLKLGQVLMVPAKLAEAPSALTIQVTDTSYIKHVVARKETLYSISKLYGVDINDLEKANPQLKGRLRKGDVINVPKIIKKVKPVESPDAVIMGRPIDEKATLRANGKPCMKIASHDVQYNIALLVPMHLELVDSISVNDPNGLKSVQDYVSFDFIQFYEGALLAADSMATLGMKVKIHVFDTDYGDQVAKTKRLLNNPQMSKMNLIIGPFFAESFNLVALFAKRNNIPVVNPLSQRSEFIKDNEYVVKLQPSTKAQYSALSMYLKAAHGSDNIVLVHRNSEENKAMSQFIKNTVTDNSTNQVKFKEVLYGSSGWNGLSKTLVNNRPNIVIVATTDRAVLPAILRDLSEAAKSKQIIVVGLSEWENMELDYSYLINLNTHFFKPWFVDYNNPDVKRFLVKFRTRFVAEPEVEKYAFLGYDATLFFMSALYNHGKDFLKCIESFDNEGLSNDFNFRQTPDGGYENQATSVYKYNDYKRVKVN